MKKVEAPCILFFLGIFLAALFAAGCSSTSSLLVSKEGQKYFLGSPDKGFHKMLCKSGDLAAILADTQLPATTKDYLYKYNCVAAVQSKEKVAAVLASMPPEQREQLSFAFQKHGYEVNYLPCD